MMNAHSYLNARAQKNVVEKPKATAKAAVDQREIKITGRRPYRSATTPQKYTATMRPIINAEINKPAK